MTSSAPSHPLAGRRVLVLRAPHQASELAERLRTAGAIPILIPAIEIAPPASYASLDSALADLAAFDLVAFTSANGVDAFHSRAQHLGLRAVPRQIAAVGPATERALHAIGLRADVVPPTFTAESLADALCPEARNRSYLLVLAEDAPPTLSERLLGGGAAVTVAAAYSNRIPDGSVAAIASLFAQPAAYPHAAIFTSASTANNLVALLQAARLTLPEAVVRASIGPVTSRALAQHNLPPHFEAKESTIPSLVDDLALHFAALQNQSCIDAPL